MQTSYFRRIASIFVLAASLQFSTSAQELPLGAQVPDPSITLTSSSGSTALSEVMGESGTVVIFWGNKCPWARKARDRVEALHSKYNENGIAFLLVNSNDPEAFRGESIASNDDAGFPFPYLSDSDGSLAAQLGATRMPHVFIFDGAMQLAYVGSLDDSPGDASKVSVSYADDALAAIAAGSEVGVPSTKAFGCMIKSRR